MKRVNKTQAFTLMVATLIGFCSIPVFPQYITVPGVGTEAQGAGVAIANLNRNPRPDLFFLAYDNRAGNNTFYYMIGQDLTREGVVQYHWNDAIAVSGMGSAAQGAGIALTNLDADGRLEMILMAYNDLDVGQNTFSYKIGMNLDPLGRTSEWTEAITIPGVGEADGAGIAVANLDNNPRPELVVMAYCDPVGPNWFCYKIGWNLSTAGVASSWTTAINIPGVGNEGQGAGITITNLDENPRPEMILMAYDAPSGPNTFRYKIGWNLNASGMASSWDAHQTVAGVGDEGQGADLVAFDLGDDSSPDLIFMAYDNPPGQNSFQYSVSLQTPNPAPKNYIVTQATCRECSQHEIDAWERTHNSQDIVAINPMHHRIGAYSANFGGSLANTFRGGNWYPWGSQTAVKQIFCGKIVEFGVTEGGCCWNEDENDWNIHMLPNPFFSYLIDLPASIREDRTEWKSVDDRDDYDGDGIIRNELTLEAEVTPDEGLFSNPYFNTNDESPPLINREICVYGAWVGDEFHDLKPEIHPSEMLWWKDSDNGPWHVILVQDDSERFSTVYDFNVPQRYIGSTPVPNPPEWWRPWAEPPISGTFKFAFRVNPEATPTNIKILEEHNRYVVTRNDPEAMRDADDDQVHAIEYNGKLVLAVEELQPRDQDLGLKFVDMCRFRNSEGNEQLQGYVAITSQVGENDDGREGFHVLRIERSREEITRKEVTVKFLRLRKLSGSLQSAFFTFSVNGQSIRFPQSGTVDVSATGSLNINRSITLDFLSVDRDNLNISFKGVSGSYGAPATFVNFTKQEDYGPGQHTAGFTIGRINPRGVIQILGTFQVDYQIEVRTIGLGEPELTQPESKSESEFPSVIFQTKILQESLQAIDNSGQKQLVADIQMRIESQKNDGTGAPFVKEIKIINEHLTANLREQPLQFSGTSNSNQVIMEAVPLLSKEGTEIEITTNNGEQFRYGLPPVSIVPFIVNEEPLSSEGDPASWPAMLAAAESGREEKIPSAELMRSRQWQFDLMPTYAPVKNGKGMPEDESPLSTILNNAVLLGSSAEGWRKIFGIDQPFKVAWSLSATDLTTGKEFSVMSGKKTRKGPLEVTISPGLIPDGHLQISFNRDRSAIYEVVATAVVTDPFGNAGTVSHKFWTHYISLAEEDAKRTDNILKLIKPSTNVSLDEMEVAMTADPFLYENSNAEIRKSQMLIFFANRAGEDGRITLGELREMIK